MKYSILILATLMSVGCTASAQQKSSSEIYTMLSNQIIPNEQCFYEQDPESDFQVNDERLIITTKLKNNKSIIMAICAPGLYQDGYIGFLINNNDVSTAKKLIFSLPEFDEKSNSWKLVDSEVIPGLAYPRQNDTFTLINNSGCAGALGYIAEYDPKYISLDQKNIPIKIRGNSDCNIKIGSDDWPEIKINE
jgi:hypothetical protein